MRYAKQFSGVLLVLLVSLHATELVAGQVWDDGELRLRYPRPPKSLDADPTLSGVLLVDLDFKGLLMKFQGLDGAALSKSDGVALRRAAPMKGKVVLFDALEAGTYALELIKISTGKVRQLLPTPRTAEFIVTPEFTVTVAPGEIRYLGVEVSKPAGFKPFAFHVNYDSTRELNALSEFKNKYANSQWGVRAEERMQSLRSAGNLKGRPQ